MDMNVYVAEWLARERLRETERRAAESRLIAEARPPRPLRAFLGRAMIQAGQWIAGRAALGAGDADPLWR